MTRRSSPAPGGDGRRGANTWQDDEDLRWAVRDWAARMAIKVGQIHCRDMETKWASMSKAGRLTMNRELLDLPKRLGEYVIVHELCHRLAPNHGRVFKSFLFAYMPDWQDRDRDLQRRASRHRS